jgi:hypothetical protein
MDAGNVVRDVPIGQSGAAAVVLCALYFLGATVTTASWVRSKFKWYEVRRVVLFTLHAQHSSRPSSSRSQLPPSSIQLQPVSAGTCRSGMFGSYQW